jgi:hypothetical protein
VKKKMRTNIGDLSNVGRALSAEELAHAVGGGGKLGGVVIGTCPKNGTSKTTYPASIHLPGEPDTATDTEKD